MNILHEWKNEREKHPFFGEKLSDERISKIWDDSAESYGEGMMGGIPDMITEKLLKDGILNEGCTVLDIGCGPGTYGLRFSKHAGEVVCLDLSEAMLDRLRRTCASEGIGNVRTVREDWLNFRSDRMFDTVFSSLCPPLNNPEAILSMERYAAGRCAYVSSMNDDRGSVHMTIWKEFGKDYTFNGYDTRYPFEYLRMIGRTPVLDEFETAFTSVRTEEETVEFEVSKFSVYTDIDPVRRKIIADVVASFAEDGKVISDGKKKVGLLTWAPDRGMNAA